MSITTNPVRNPKTKILKSPKYGIIFHNNEKTTMDQVLYLLITVFKYNEKTAAEKVFQIHNEGKGVVFISTKEMCDLKNEDVKNIRKFIKEEHLIHTVEII